MQLVVVVNSTLAGLIIIDPVSSFSRTASEEMFTLARGDRPGVRNILLVFTDGNSGNPRLTLQEAAKAKAKDIHITATVIGRGDNLYSELKGMVSDPSSKNLIQVRTSQELNNKKEMYRKLICNGRCILISH